MIDVAKKKDGATVKTSIVLPEDLHWELKRRAVDLKLSDTAAIREAIREWVEKRDPAAPKAKRA